MRDLTPGEILSLKALLQMESNALAKAKAVKEAISDENLKTLNENAIQGMESRIRGLQQFIIENNIISIEGVN